MTTTLTDSEIRVALSVLMEYERLRRHVGRPIPPSVARLHHHLTLMSAHGHETAVPATQSNSRPTEVIDAQEAATILGITTRHVRRLAADLDGHQIAGRWVFHRPTVIDYQQGQRT